MVSATKSVSPDPGGAGRAAFAVLATIFFMWGLVTVLNDVMVPHLKSVFALSYTQTLLIQFVFFGAYFLLALPSSKLIEWLGYKGAIVCGLVVMALGAFLFVPAASVPSYPLFLAALFVLASGMAVLQVAANPYVALMGPPQTASSRLNLAQAFNSLGTAIAPVLGGLVILANSAGGASKEGAVLTHAQRMADALAVRPPYAAITLLLFALAAFIGLWKLPKPATEAAPEGLAATGLRRQKRLWLGVGAVFCYVGGEVAIGSFLTNYISGRSVGDMTHAAAAAYVSLYWGGAMAGRFIGSAVLRFTPAPAALAFNAAAASLLVVGSILTSGHLSMWLILSVGLMNSIMFPTIFTLAIEGLGHLTQRGSGFLVMAIVGGALIPQLQAFVADQTGLRVSFLVAAACYLYVLAFAVIARRPMRPG